MREARVGLMIAVPAAVALLSLIWFLRKRSGKKDNSRSRKDPGNSQSHKPEVQLPFPPTHREKQGITLTQRKIPKEPIDDHYGSGEPNVNSTKSIQNEINYEDSLTSSQKIKVQELVQSAIGVGIVEASQCLKGEGGGDNVVDKNVKGGDDQPTEVTEDFIQEVMTVTAVAPAYQTPSRSSHYHINNRESSNDDQNGNCSDMPSLGAYSPISQSKIDTMSVGVDNKSGVENSHCSLDAISSSTSIPISMLSQSTVSPATSSSDDHRLSQSESSWVSSSFTEETENLNTSFSVAVNSCEPSDVQQKSKAESLVKSQEELSLQQKPTTSGTTSSTQSQPDEPPANSISPVCDSNSVGSNDSGRGGSEQDSTIQMNENLIHYDFNMPSELCGRLIGRQGKNINLIKTKSGASVSLTNNPFTPEFQICQVIGSQSEVDEALAQIRRKFPLNNHPGLTMGPLNLPIPSQMDQSIIVPEGVQLSLPEGVSVDVYVSAIVNAGHVCVQQPTHRTFMSLEKLNFVLNSVYSQDLTIPCVPEPIECGVICVCESDGAWYRTMITSLVDESGECQVKFVDYGGYGHLPISSLKQIRTDFMSLPFQAVECFMANISPMSGENYFSDVATLALSERTQMKLLKCQVVARSEDGTPFIHLYDVDPNTNTAIMLNRCLVDDSFVRWVEIL